MAQQGIDVSNGPSEETMDTVEYNESSGYF